MDGAPKTPFSPKCARSPMKPFVALAEKVKENPQKYHWKLMTEPATIQAHISDKADFLRARPEYKKPRPGTITNT